MKKLWILLVLASLAAAGCVERRLYVRSDPPGAEVYIDGEPVGVTRPDDHPDGPFYVTFVHYGSREYTLRKPGYATASGLVVLETPWFEYPVLDFFSEVLIPWKILDEHELRVKLVKARPADIDALYRRAGEYRDEKTPDEAPLKEADAPADK